MDRNRDGGEGWMVRGWHALTFVVECEVLALTLNPRTPMANLIRSLRGGASACRAAPAPLGFLGSRADTQGVRAGLG